MIKFTLDPITPIKNGLRNYMKKMGRKVMMNPATGNFVVNHHGKVVELKKEEVTGFVISGGVWLYAVGDTPIAGLTLRLSGDASGDTLTDENGLYSFEVIPGTYNVNQYPCNIDQPWSPCYSPGDGYDVTITTASVPNCDFVAILT